MQKVRAVRHPWMHYLLLAGLSLAALLFHVRLTRDILSGKTELTPNFAPGTASNVVQVVRPEAATAGLRRGDFLVAINGRPYTGTAVYAEELSRTRAEELLPMTVKSLRSGRWTEVALQVPAKKANSSGVGLAVDLVLHSFLPIFCLALGFWAVAARPRDPLAWLLLAVMLSFPQIFLDFPQVFEVHTVESWGSGIRAAGMAYHSLLAYTCPIFMYLFGLYFPEPFPARSLWKKVWIVLFCVGVVPIAIAAVADAVIAVTQITNYSAVTRLYMALLPLRGYLATVFYPVFGSFFLAMSLKFYLSTSIDAKRRLRLLNLGISLAMAPATVLIIIAQIRGKFVYEIVQDWRMAIALISMVIFPITLAHVIVVQRAMDVRVVVRQGLQYALARNGIRILQVITTAVVLVAGVTLAGRGSRVQSFVIIAVGVLAVFTIRQVADRLRIWTDRRFFREAYNAEQVLMELGEHVRTIVERRPLLETVTRRISETLHVPKIAVLLNGNEAFETFFALGYSNPPRVALPSTAATIRHLRENAEPAKIYLDDPDFWINSQTDVDEEERSRLAALDSELILPLGAGERLLGFISLGPKRSEEPYSGSDLRLLKSVAVQTGLALENADLMEAVAQEVAARERFNREIEIAREVQERLFPQKLPVIDRLDYAGRCRPAFGVGGDYYDFLGLADGWLGVAIGDVSGKGIAAALTMSALQAALRGELARSPEDLAAVVAHVNQLLYELSDTNRYATFFYGQYRPASRQFTYVNAGHNPPFLFHNSQAGRRMSRLETGGTVVGLVPEFPYQQGVVTLAPGDVLVAFTDGASEAMNTAGEEWGEERLIRTIEPHLDHSALQIVEQIIAGVDAFAGQAGQHDDITLVVLRVLP